MSGPKKSGRSGGQQAGRAFLEKIIQVPLHLPPVDTVSLRLVAFEGVEAALSMAGIDLKQAQVDAFIRHFVDGLEGWEIESGLPVRGSFERRSFDAVERLVGSEYVMSNLVSRYGADLDNLQEYPPREWPAARKVAHQFALIYRYVQQSQAATQEGGQKL